MSELRDQERSILAFLFSAVSERDDRISVYEIQRTLGIRDRATVEAALRKLERGGYFRSDPNAPSGFAMLRGLDDSSVSRRLARNSSSALTEPAPPNPSRLPPRQREAYEFIRERVLGLNPPSIPEIAGKLNLSSTNRAHELLERLEDRGFIRLPRDPGKRRRARSIELVGYRPPPQGVPTSSAYVRVLGRTAAGSPVLAEAGQVEWMQLPRELMGRNDPDQVFLLDVEGDSMVGDSVLDGDRVVVRSQHEAADGDMVVAEVANPVTGKPETTVKRYRLRGGHPWLAPSNPNYEPIDADDAAIVGKVIAVLRYPL